MQADAYPLAPIQQGMLFHWLLDRHSGTDLEQIIGELDEPVDPPRLEAAWNVVLDLYGTLRTAFDWDGPGPPTQRVEDQARIRLAFHDLRDFNSDDRERYIEAYLEADRREGFDLATAPAMRVALFRLDDAHSRMVWSIHHILIDGRSFEVILRAVFAAYDTGAPPAVQDRPYREYIEWVVQQDQSAARGFWRQQLAGFGATTPLPFDHFGAPVTGVGEREATLTPGTTRALRELSAREDLSLNSIVMAAWALLLSRHTGESDIVFGATKTTRRGTIPDADQIVGLFLATIPVRISVQLDVPVREWLQQVRASWNSLRGNEHLPLVDIKQVSRLPAGSPLFDSLVVFENYRFATRLRRQGGAWSNRDVPPAREHEVSASRSWHTTITRPWCSSSSSTVAAFMMRRLNG